MNTDTLEEMEADGFCGRDASLNESLVEYGLAWKLDGDDWLFIYRHPYKEKRFDWARVRTVTDPFKEWDWALEGHNGENFFSSHGITADEWRKFPLEQQVADLFSYWGGLEIFGESYNTGRRIAGLEW